LTGKIIFYSAVKGEGIIITPEEQKYKFSIYQWADDEALPMVGDVVEFRIENLKAVEIKPKNLTVSKDEIKNINVDKLEKIPSKKNAQRVIEEYFKDTLELLQNTEKIVKDSKVIDYTKMQRFLHTTFEHLQDKDPEFIDDKLSNIKLNLDNTYTMAKNFKSKLVQPVQKFDVLFLKTNAYYKKVLSVHQDSKDKYNYIKSQEGTTLQKIEFGEEKLKKLKPKSKEYQEINNRLKALRSHYVKMTDNKQLLEKRIRHTHNLLKTFVDANKDKFLKIFKKRGDELSEYLLIVLNKLAFAFDDYMWKIAIKSNAIQEFFLNANIDGGFNSRTFLKYYLKGLNKSKLNDEQKMLIQLQQYLEDLAKKSLVILKEDRIQDKFTFLTNHINHFFKVEIMNPNDFNSVMRSKHIDYLIIYLYSFEKERDIFNLITKMKVINKHIDIIIVSSTFPAGFKQEAELRNVNNLLCTQGANEKILKYLEVKMHAHEEENE
jgi:hypothetical protein